MSVSQEQRFVGGRRCPVCGGSSADAPGTGTRCYGFVSSDGRFAHCTREEHGGDLSVGRAGAFAHRLGSCCRCGVAHGTAGALAAERKHDIPVRGPGDRSSLALKMWNRSVDATGTVVESYLRARGITIAIPSSLRLLRDALHPSGRRFPAMLAAVRNAMGEIVAVHRTFLSADGTSKAAVPDAKMMLGPCGGRAVHLAAAGRTIAIAEGIETALSVAEATGLPTWAALSAHGVATLLLPELPIGRDIVIFADNDPAGLSAANRARARFLLEERRVRVVVPEHPGSDFNDVLRGAA